MRSTLVSLILLFAISQILGIFTGYMIFQDMNKNPFVTDLVVNENTNDPGNALFFIGYIIFSAVLMMVLIKYIGRFPWIFKLLEFGIVASSSSIVFYSFLRLGFGYEVSTLGGTVFGLIFSAVKLLQDKINLKNPAAILSTAGVGVIFGVSLGFVPAVLFLVMLAIYDFLAVFISKHMVQLATFVMEKNMAFTITVENEAVDKEEASQKSTDKVKAKKISDMDRRIDLGTGDLIAPLMLSVSVLQISIIASILVSAGAIITFGAFLMFLRKEKVILPALPPIVFGMFLFFIIGKLAGLY
jgi:presenilin-like A22 family membrane protease